MICINCQQEYNSNYCPNCGEKAARPKITFSSILADAIRTISNMDSGFLFNLKNLFIAPQQVINAYLLGKRRNIFNPISYLLLCVSLYVIVDALVVVKYERSTTFDTEIYSIGLAAGKFIKQNLKYFWVLAILWLSLSTHLIFRRYNFAEHLAINAFTLGQATLVSAAIFPFSKTPLLFDPLIYLVVMWILYQVFKKKVRDWEVIAQALAAALLFFILLFAVIVLIGVLKT